MKGVIVFTDVKSSSKLWGTYPDEMLAALKKHEAIIVKYINKTDGFLVKTIGDAFMIKFGNLMNAIKFTIATQQHFKRRPIKFKGGEDILAIRIGIAYGEFSSRNVVMQDYKMKDFFGQTVNLASRMESKVSPVGGFGLAAEGVDEKMLSYIEQFCTIDKITFKYKCDVKEQPIRSGRMVYCRDIGQLHLDDGKDYEAYLCTLK